LSVRDKDRHDANVSIVNAYVLAVLAHATKQRRLAPSSAVVTNH
jgi:hypothetical protein